MQQSAQRAPNLHQWDIRDSKDLPLPGTLHLTQTTSANARTSAASRSASSSD